MRRWRGVIWNCDPDAICSVIHKNAHHASFPLPLLHTADMTPQAEQKSSSTGSSDVLTPQYTPQEIEKVNSQLENATPQEILQWAIDNLDGLYQTTAFGLTGTAAVDMISKICLEREEVHLVPLVSLCPHFSSYCH